MAWKWQNKFLSKIIIMKNTMKAVTYTKAAGIKLQNVPLPDKAEPGHLLIKMQACAITQADKAIIAGIIPKGAGPESQFDICGVSGTGIVLEAGEGVPGNFKGKKVAISRSLQKSDQLVGAWSPFAHLHYLQCAILPDDADMDAYSGSLVSAITPYSCLQQILDEGHKGIINTAATSATGLAMLAFCNAYGLPSLSVARNEAGKQKLQEMGAAHIVVQTDEDFKAQFGDMATRLSATGIFDGVGADLLNGLLDVLPNNATIYSYGYLGGNTPYAMPGRLLMIKGLKLTGFANIRSKTVQEPQRLAKALVEISKVIHLPHFETKIGKRFKLEDYNEALKFAEGHGAKAVLDPWL
jgi:NADPH2:quinone reductase